MCTAEWHVTVSSLHHLQPWGRPSAAPVDTARLDERRRDHCIGVGGADIDVTQPWADPLQILLFYFGTLAKLVVFGGEAAGHPRLISTYITSPTFFL